jgi:hypothetical protein
MDNVDLSKYRMDNVDLTKYKIVIKPIKQKVKETDPVKLEAMKQKEVNKEKLVAQTYENISDFEECFEDVFQM